MQIAAEARANKSATAIARGRWANRVKNRSRCGKTVPGPMRKNRTETEKSPMRKNRTTGSVQKTALLSISWVKGPGWQPGLSSSCEIVGGGLALKAKTDDTLRAARA
jgi:hypothetical protein